MQITRRQFIKTMLYGGGAMAAAPVTVLAAGQKKEKPAVGKFNISVTKNNQPIFDGVKIKVTPFKHTAKRGGETYNGTRHTMSKDNVIIGQYNIEVTCPDGSVRKRSFYLQEGTTNKVNIPCD